MSNILSPGELLDLTGTPQKSKQVEILRDYGIHPIVTKSGVKVTWEAINAAMHPGTSISHQADVTPVGVNLMGV